MSADREHRGKESRRLRDAKREGAADPARPHSAADRAGGRLPSEVQREIVVRLAQFESPTEVQAAIKTQFGREVSLPHILYYDASKATPDLAPEWRDLFRAARERFVTETADIAVAHRAVRLRKLGEMAEAAKRRGNYALAGKLLEQAAKECGEFFTNTRVLQVGDPVDLLAKLLGMTPEEVRETVGGAAPPAARDAA